MMRWRETRMQEIWMGGMVMADAMSCSYYNPLEKLIVDEWIRKMKRCQMTR